ncbi:MAG TPA: histidine kinase dimerization/phospho-acceptor domain-containing protein, partial [Thermoanaerobaculia bacterium]|nr:histidine kinase dimerization/phospho-acceptor domain-containing protein [Thermoanaerobaculia bacterium]
MTELGRHLLEHSEEIIDRWYRDWTASDHPHEDVPVALLRDNLAEQLRIIGRSLQSDTPELPSEMWEVAGRLHPEERVEQQIPIEEEVLSYKILVSVVREWVEENEIEVTSRHYAFFYETIFELVAESVKRYTRYRENQVREDRSRHVAAIAHQMKTPIATLSIAAQLLAKDPTIEPEILDPMRRAVRRLELMTGGLMRLERFRAEEIPVRPATIRVENLVAEIVEYHHAPA